ncbi:peptidoglycan-binding domain-containing protein [Mycobacterium sp. NPDC051198]
MSVIRINADYAMGNARARDDRAYGYGGVWHPTNLARTTDCSGIVTHTLDGLVNGIKMTWSRHGISTESYRYVGGPGSKGPFGTIRVGSPGDIPTDAALRIGLQHGPGGGANSHMACTLLGVNIESSGSYGQQCGGQARGYNHPMFHDWFYLPGPIVGTGTATPTTPTAPGAVYLGEDYENTGDRVLQLQTRLNLWFPAYSNLIIDGEFGPATAAVVREFQSRSNLTIDGIAGPATLAALGLSFQPQEVPPVTAPQLSDRQVLEKILDNTNEIRKQLEPAGDPSWPSKGTSIRDKVYAIATKLGV